jgi:cyclopropane fatty-acyl-phospholipid synthase-like methyltransferase
LTEVWRLYERFAEEYDRERTRGLMERGYLGELTTRLKDGASVLDLGCGAGEPIAQFLVNRGYDVTGIDAAPAMIALCRRRSRHANWIVADMRTLDLGRRFDAIVAWDSFFHLDADEQRAMFGIFEAHIAPRGLLLFTSGPAAGTAIGDLCGEELFHASLSAEEYERLLEGAGFTVIRHEREDPDCGFHTVWLAQYV